MGEHRFRNLLGLLQTTSWRQRLQLLGWAFGIVLLVSVMSFGFFKPNLSRMLDVNLEPKKPEQLEQISVGQNAGFMGHVLEQQRAQQQQAAEIDQLKQASTTLRNQLARALRTKPDNGDLSRTDVQQMINQQLAQARQAPAAPRPPQTPPKPRLVAAFVPPKPSLVPDAIPNRMAKPEPVETAVVLSAGSSALGIALNGFLAQSTNRQDDVQSVAIGFISPLTGAGGASVPTDGCRAVAACRARDIIARGLCELEVVTCTLRDNRTITIPVSGWITAEDNVNGNFGTVIWNDLELYRRMAEATLPGILAELLDLTDNAIDSVSPDGVVQTRPVSPLADVASDLSQMLLDRVRLFIFPIVAVERDQRVNIYIRETAYARGTQPGDWIPRPVSRVSPYN